jgi:WD40 repeat protein
MKNGNIISGSGDKSIKIWNGNTYECLATVTGHEKYVFSLLVLDKELFASGGYDSQIVLWKHQA